MKIKMLAIAAALVLAPVAAQAAMDCCKDCKCCDEKKAEAPKPEAPKPEAPADAHKH